MSEDKPGTIVTPEFRAFFPNLFTPKPVVINGKTVGEPRYDIQMGFEPDTLDAMKKTAARVAREKWEGRELKELKFPFKNGDKEADRAKQRGKDREAFRGLVIVSASSQYKPGVSDKRGEPILDPDHVYSGCYGYAEVNLKAYEGVGNNPDGVTAYLNFFMKSREGERVLSGGRLARDVFAGVIGKETAEDPTGDLDDEIPL